MGPGGAACGQRHAGSFQEQGNHVVANPPCCTALLCSAQQLRQANLQSPTATSYTLPSWLPTWPRAHRLP
jgi:hypothetical protein